MNRHSADMFLHATGGTAPFCITVDSSSQGSQVYSNAGWRRQFKFDQPFILVGNHERADLRLDSDSISRRQVYLQLLNGRVFATSLSSRIPTLWGTRAQTSGWVEPGGSLRIGPYTLRFDGVANAGGAASPSINPLAAESFAGPPVTFLLQGGRSGADQAVIDRILTLVGHAPPCKLVMKSSRVSAIHCSLVRTAEGLWVTDLASREGVEVNGQSVRFALLAEGDLLQIGGRRIEVRYGKRPRRAPKPKRTKPERRPAPPPTETDAAESNPPDDAQSEPPSDLIHVNNEATQLRPLDEVEQWVPISALEPIIDRMNELQAQTYEQFQEIMNAMILSFGSMFMEHREFVGQEMEKLERLARALAEARTAPEPALPKPAESPATPAAESPAVRPPQAAPSPGTPPPPAPPAPRPRPANTLGKVPSGDEFHLWIAQRIAQLGKQRSNKWDNVLAVLRSKLPGASR